MRDSFNPLNAELNPICHLVALLGVYHFLHVSRIRVKLYHRGHGYLSVGNVVCCQVEVSATS